MRKIKFESVSQIEKELADVVFFGQLPDPERNSLKLPDQVIAQMEREGWECDLKSLPSGSPPFDNRWTASFYKGDQSHHGHDAMMWKAIFFGALHAYGVEVE